MTHRRFHAIHVTLEFSGARVGIIALLVSPASPSPRWVIRVCYLFLSVKEPVLFCLRVMLEFSETFVVPSSYVS